MKADTGLQKSLSALQMSNDEINSKLFTRFTLLCTSQMSYVCSVMFNLLHNLQFIIVYMQYKNPLHVQVPILE